MPTQCAVVNWFICGWSALKAHAEALLPSLQKKQPVGSSEECDTVVPYWFDSNAGRLHMKLDAFLKNKTGIAQGGVDGGPHCLLTKGRSKGTCKAMHSVFEIPFNKGPLRYYYFLTLPECHSRIVWSMFSFTGTWFLVSKDKMALSAANSLKYLSHF